MTPSASGTYAPLTTATWAVGDSLTAAGAGDPSAVPAFSGTATAPPAVDITSPVAGGTFSPAQVSVSHALVVQWDGTGGTNVYTFLYTASGGATPTITCKTGDVGHVTIPSTIMAALAGQLGGALAVGRANSSDASSANSQVTVYALTANGIAVQFTP